jgi:hypothetical protein
MYIKVFWYYYVQTFTVTDVQEILSVFQWSTGYRFPVAIVACLLRRHALYPSAS